MIRHERRRSARVPAVRHERLPIQIRDVSLGGFLLETAHEMAPDSVQDFHLTRPDGTSMVLRGRVVHSRRVRQPHGGDVCMTGVAFLEDVTSAPAAERHQLAS